MTDKLVYCWEFEYWDKNEEEWMECEYYTHSEDISCSSNQLIEDEGGDLDYKLLGVKSVTMEEFLMWYGDGSDDLILDR